MTVWYNPFWDQIFIRGGETSWTVVAGATVTYQTHMFIWHEMVCLGDL